MAGRETWRREKRLEGGHRRGRRWGPLAILVHRIDGTQYSSVATAMGKARTAVAYKRPNPHPGGNGEQGRFSFLSAGRRPGGLQGGLPVEIDGQLVLPSGLGGPRRATTRSSPRPGSTPSGRPSPERAGWPRPIRRQGGTNSGMGTPRPLPFAPFIPPSRKAVSRFRLRPGPQRPGRGPGAAHPGLRMVRARSRHGRGRGAFRRNPQGPPLYGVPVGGEGHHRHARNPHAHGLAHLREPRAGALRRARAPLEALGGLVMGKTVTTEFAFRQPQDAEPLEQRATRPAARRAARGGRVATGFVRWPSARRLWAR